MPAGPRWSPWNDSAARIGRPILTTSDLARTTRPGSVDIALLAVAVVWGSSYPTAKEVVTTDSVFAFLVIRFTIATTGWPSCWRLGYGESTVQRFFSA